MPSTAFLLLCLIASAPLLAEEFVPLPGYEPDLRRQTMPEERRLLDHRSVSRHAYFADVVVHATIAAIEPVDFPFRDVVSTSQGHFLVTRQESAFDRVAEFEVLELLQGPLPSDARILLRSDRERDMSGFTRGSELLLFLRTDRFNEGCYFVSEIFYVPETHVDRLPLLSARGHLLLPDTPRLSGAPEVGYRLSDALEALRALEVAREAARR
ncbi:MAG: hypothetical protein AAGE01_25100 [Pseudomonadota bacterium]